jgi:hypothetical protein
MLDPSREFIKKVGTSTKMTSVKKIYNNIHLNLGIKRFIEKILIPKFEATICFIENRTILPINSVFVRYLYKRISYHYGASYRMENHKSQNLDTKTGNYGYGYIHYALVRNLRPSRVLCVGSMYGFIPFMCALACKENKRGVVDFVDAGYDINNPEDIDRHNWGQGFWKKVSPTKHFSFMKAEKYINTHVMTTKSYAKKYPERMYEYIYIDGDHSYEGVKTDYKLFWPMLKKGGFMAFHDTDNKGVHGSLYYDVNRFCKEFIYPKGNFLHFPNPSSGLVIVQKSNYPKRKR